jgi:hypothetical protein
VQIFWPVKGCPVDEFTEAQLLLISRAGGDPAVKDATRLMRLAGYYHLKREPRMTRIVWADRRIRYEYRDLIRRIRAQPQVCDPLASGARRTTTTIVVAGRRRMSPYPATDRLSELLKQHNELVIPAVKELIEEVGKAGHGRHDALVVIAGRLVQLRWPYQQAVDWLTPTINESFNDGDWSCEIEAALNMHKNARRSG